MKIFSEIYSTYYSITEKILGRGEATLSDIREVIGEHGFSETMLFLEPKLIGSDGFGLLNEKKDVYRSILKKAPHIPLTALEKHWLCAVLCDRRSGLFLDAKQRDELMKLLGDEPLFQGKFFNFFDRFSDGDDYGDESYIRHFCDILTSIHDRKLVKISFNTRKGNRITHYFLPERIEYSSKNDRFRIHAIRYRKNKPIDTGIINMSHIIMTECTDITPVEAYLHSELKREAVVRIRNERNAINRFMMEFAELERVSEYDEDKNECEVRMKYKINDEAEILIRLLSFGPVVEVIGPEPLRESVKLRVKRQSLLPKLAAPK